MFEGALREELIQGSDREPPRTTVFDRRKFSLCRQLVYVLGLAPKRFCRLFGSEYVKGAHIVSMQKHRLF